MTSAASDRRTLFRYAYRRSSDHDRRAPARHPVAVVGAGPVGLTAAIDLALRGVQVVLLDDSDRIGEGSRGICHAKRSLEIWDRLGIAERLVALGVTWQRGKVFCGDALAYSFDLLPEQGHKMPAFINLQQYVLERTLVERAQALAAIDLRWRNKVVGADTRGEAVRLTVDTPDGPYRLDADWVIAADGVRSTMRNLLGLRFAGLNFEDKFLIADIRMAADLPTERRFWFNPAFHSGASALMHRQPDNIWRIDLQLGPEADATEERKPERVLPRLRRMLGARDIALEWTSVYSFQCRRLDRFVHGRVIFAGDAAHQLSPFGARGGNSGVQDAENIAWKLAALIHGEAGPRLLESYNAERIQAADENIAHSTRATDFIAPHSRSERTLRDAVLALAPRAEFARNMVNSGRLSTATAYNSPLSTPDEDSFAGTARLGAPAPDAPVSTGRDRGFLLERLSHGFELLHVAGGHAAPAQPGIATRVIGRDLLDESGAFAQRFDGTPGATYLLRPDHHLCARWRRYVPNKVAAAMRRALGH